MSEKVIKLTHDYGMKKIKNIPGVISATHVTRKKYILDAEGKKTSVPEYLIRVRVQLKNETTVDREIKLTTHPNEIGIKEYNYIVNNLFKDGQ